MPRPFVDRLVVQALASCAAFGVFASTSALPSDLSDLDTDTARHASALSASSPWASPVAPAPGVVVKPPERRPATAERALSANPLWAVPLASLSNTRERPIFSPSRRPPPPATVPVLANAPLPPKPARVERPQLSLVGTIVGGDQSFAIFVDPSSKAALRLKLGEDYQGWTLRSVHGREAILERNQQTAVLSLPQPGAGEAGPLRVQAENVAPTPVPADPPPRAGGRH